MFSHSRILSTMRTYSNKFRYTRKASNQDRATRVATEWDIRLDINEQQSYEFILQNIKNQLDNILYVLISGIEEPDKVTAPDTGIKWRPSSSGSHGEHVHIALVLYVPRKRNEVLQLCRGARKLTDDEYCTPRNPKFTYAGWILHHTKPNNKVKGEPLVRYENGTCPMDPFTTDSAMAIKRMVDKFGSELITPRYTKYLELLTRDKIKQQIENLQMLLEDRSA